MTPFVFSQLDDAIGGPSIITAAIMLHVGMGMLIDDLDGSSVKVR